MEEPHASATGCQGHAGCQEGGARHLPGGCGQAKANPGDDGLCVLPWHPEAGLTKLIRHLGIEMPPNPSLFTKLATLLREILECSDAELAQLSEMRLDKSQEEFTQLCEMDDAADLCETREDGKILEKEVEQTKAGLEVQASYCKGLRELAISVGSKGAKAKGTKCSIKGSSSSSKATAASSTRAPRSLPEDSVFDEDVAQSLLPPSYAITKVLAPGTSREVARCMVPGILCCWCARLLGQGTQPCESCRSMRVSRWR